MLASRRCCTQTGAAATNAAATLHTTAAPTAVSMLPSTLPRPNLAPRLPSRPSVPQPLHRRHTPRLPMVLTCAASLPHSHCFSASAVSLRSAAKWRKKQAEHSDLHSAFGGQTTRQGKAASHHATIDRVQGSSADDALASAAGRVRYSILDSLATPVSNLPADGTICVGDLVEVRSPSASAYVIASPTGHTSQYALRDVLFHAPGWATSPAANADAIITGMDSVFVTEDLRAMLVMAGIPEQALQAVGRFREEAEALSYEFRDAFRRLHSSVVGPKGLDSLITLDEAARRVFRTAVDEKSSGVKWTELYATHLYLMRDSRHFYIRSSDILRSRREVLLRSQNEVQQIAALERESMASLPGPALSSFLEKVRARLEWAKERAPKTLLAEFTDTTSQSDASLSEVPPDIVYTESDWMFLDCIKRAAFPNSPMLDPYTSIFRRGILSRIDALNSGASRRSSESLGYPWGASAEMVRPTAIRLLIDLGVMRSWRNTSLWATSASDEHGEELAAVDGNGLSNWADSAEQERDAWGAVMLDSLGVTNKPSAQYPTLTSKTLSAIASPNNTPGNSPSDTGDASRGSIASITVDKTVFPRQPIRDAFHTSTDPASIESDGVLRRDFGDLPVYVIDSATAHELDDGISYERLPNGDEWVHIHIADPTSVIPHNHPLALLAQLRGSSIYLPERHYPMLPDILSERVFNLGCAGSGNPQPAMTFSARLGADGEILDWSVSPSFVRNVRILHYRSVNAILSWEDVYGFQTSRVGLDPWIQHAFDTLAPADSAAADVARKSDPAAAADLLRLQSILRRHLMLRVSRGGFVSDQPGFAVKVPVPDYPLPHDTLRPTRALDDPRSNGHGGSASPAVAPPIIVLDPTAVSHVEPAPILVSECMILAGRVAAKFFQERRLPAAYRGQAAPRRDVDPAAAAAVDAARAAVDSRSGVLPFWSHRDVIPAMSPSSVSTRPLAHCSMGILGPADAAAAGSSGLAGYVKVTSPLRRYSDAMLHWQIKAALSVTAPAGSGSPHPPPFAEDEVARLAARLHRLERTARRAGRAADRFWALEWLRRREVLWRAGAPSALLAGYGAGTPDAIATAAALRAAFPHAAPEALEAATAKVPLPPAILMPAPEPLLSGPGRSPSPRPVAVWSDAYRGRLPSDRRADLGAASPAAPRPEYLLAVTQAPPPQRRAAAAASASTPFAVGILADLGGIAARLVMPAGAPDRLGPGDLVPCVIDTVDPHAGVLVVRPA
ncbi:hypothetical protein HK405_015470 [Cladochytrium tenue]|nr:hypothetical protein HK405_015470 [Cladochytrium tenue]